MKQTCMCADCIYLRVFECEQVQKNRDVINNSLRAYAALPATKAFVQHLLTRANIHSIGKSTADAEEEALSLMAGQPKSAGIATAQGSRAGGVRRGSVMSGGSGGSGGGGEGSAAGGTAPSGAAGRRKAVSGAASGNNAASL